MNRGWSELNKTMQVQLRKRDTYQEGVATLFKLRNELMETLISLKEELNREEFDKMPFLNAEGYHSKTIAYSIWHIFRIEDIVVQTLMKGEGQVLFTGNYQERIQSPIITTGNELQKKEIGDFSKQLDLEELYSYILEVKKRTEQFMVDLPFEELKTGILVERKEHLSSLNVVSPDENAAWLVDYWCNKKMAGLIQMPLSRHWIMHIEASLRIKNKIHP